MTACLPVNAWAPPPQPIQCRMQKLLKRLVDAEPEAFLGGLSLCKAMGLTRTSHRLARPGRGDYQSGP